MFFSSACLEANKEKVMNILQVENIAQEEKYLGHPTPEGKITKDQFKSTKQKPKDSQVGQNGICQEGQKKC
jgi:hypothetical protein